MSYLKFKQLTYDTKICEVCGTEFITDYGYSLAVCWLVTGHANIGAFMCPESPGNQHWGCSPEHALEAAMLCAKEHMIPHLDTKHVEAKKGGLSRIALEHKHFLDETKENFHHLKNVPKRRQRRIKNGNVGNKV